MASTRHPWTPADLEPLAICGDCNADVVVTEVEQDVFTAVVSHDDSCPWFRAFMRSGADQIRLYTRDQP